MSLVVICRWCEVDVCRDPGNVSNFIIAQHTVLRFVDARICHVCGSVTLEVASRGLRAKARDNGRTT